MRGRSAGRIGFWIGGAMTAALAAFAPAPSLAAKPFTCGDECLQALYDWVVADVKHYLPYHYSPSERFEDSVSQGACPVEHGPLPRVHAVVLAPLYPHFVEYKSSQNDARLMRDFFTERGVSGDSLKVLMGRDVGRAAAVAALAETLRCVRERDQVVVVMSGDGGSYNRLIAPSLDGLKDVMCKQDGLAPLLKELCRNLGNLTADSNEDVTSRYAKALSDHDEMLFFTSEVKFNREAGRKDRDTRLIGIGAFDLSNFVTQVRNRGADAFILIDASYAAGFNLADLQRRSVADGSWFWNTYTSRTPPPVDIDNNLVALFGTGNFASFYAAADNQIAGDTGGGADGERLGHLPLAFTETLREASDLPLVTMAERVTAHMKANGANQQPIFAASSTGLRFLDVEQPGLTAENQIDIIAPAPKRGAAGVEEKSFTLVARYTGPGHAARAIVDGDVVPVDGNGQFRRDIEDTGGKLSIAIRVLSADFSTLATSELKLREAGDEPIVPQGRRRFALVIANENYAATESFPRLKTPEADAEAVTKILTSRFGFATTIDGARPLDLFLRDATKAQIQQVLYELRQRLTPEDQLLVYYAGHGESDPDLGAFWVPVDGQAKADFTWVAAEEITRELKRMNAGSILVISDSCYAGGLSRGAAAEQPEEGARERYLAKASRLKARQLIASGGDEPVEDGGGGGHSVFARALIEALQEMPGKAFTASELFEEKVKPAVISAANAVSEGQTPGFSRIARGGDEPGSEFVFQVAP